MDESAETGLPDATTTSAASEQPASAIRWVLIALVVVALVLFIAWARREPGFDDRVPDPEDAVGALVITVERGAA